MITSIEKQRFEVPLAEVLVNTMHVEHTHFELITATVRDADNVVLLNKNTM